MAKALIFTKIGLKLSYFCKKKPNLRELGVSLASAAGNVARKLPSPGGQALSQTHLAFGRWNTATSLRKSPYRGFLAKSSKRCAVFFSDLVYIID